MPAALMIGHHFSMSAFGRGAERLGRKFFARRNFPSQRADSLAHDRVRQGIHDRGTELGDDVLRHCAIQTEKWKPGKPPHPAASSTVGISGADAASSAIRRCCSGPALTKAGGGSIPPPFWVFS